MCLGRLSDHDDRSDASLAHFHQTWVMGHLIGTWLEQTPPASLEDRRKKSWPPVIKDQVRGIATNEV
ncbi:hypothetical protein A7K73_00635 [Candidatus Methylacidiphilum fumarolicum]|uniref:Uncharacterized protein n=2 Tax=Candidatus Methylacidiphilum fumarolicum TaxID=591154 RepID=I0JVJ2_METFB|nr:hypothetical protein A7K73_00635 [Candidatus Methylacidiphilum fumarolicum]TFE76579.1 hypothetical protein A7D33_09575 [Candidatus Methylacidiphilum fumarolicum]CAI9084589.1 conserved protein of unknown function [Candidatus Methylacidiphilum fumarolicum]CCG91261.1 hypothetical protein MFUM_1010085 [Methylacidiphilum fumariolicum SolV]